MNSTSVVFLVSCVLAVSALAEPEHPDLAGPLLEGLGDLHHPVTTHAPLAQRYFDQGLTLCFAFNHEEAIRAFRSAAQLDPSCAMAQWGIALANGPHVNKPMMPINSAAAWEALQRALELQTNSSPRERAYIAALAKRYQAAHQEDRSALDKAYAAAMRGLVVEYPDDLDAQTLFAESLMDTMPWDYWRKDRSPKPETEEALAALRFVLGRNPDHPGANHYLIHTVEAGPNPEWGLPAALRLAHFAPTAGHLVHMPSHIFMRVGQYDEAVAANERAVQADQAYLRQSHAQGFYPGVYYPHNIHFLWWALLLQGRSTEAANAAAKAAQFASDNYCSPSKAFEAPRFRHLPWLTDLRFARWERLLRIDPPAATNDFLIDRSIWHFVRGLAFAAQHQIGQCSRELDDLSLILKSTEIKQLDNPQLPVTSILAVAERWLKAKVAGVQGDLNGEIQLLEEAVKLEESLPYMEPAYWPLSVRPALGAALLRANKPDQAERVFRQDLERMPRNGWGLFGLEKSLRAQGRNDVADDVAVQFDVAWKNADTKLTLDGF